MVDQEISEPTGLSDVDGLIQRLPLEAAIQAVVPGRCQVFEQFNGDPGTSPAHRLAKLGYKAVPRLIAALADRRFTHTTDSGKYSKYVYRVGDLAFQILQHISARSFVLPYDYVTPQNLPHYRTEISKWWTRAEKIGEFADLKEGLERSHGEDLEAAKALEERYPHKAARAIGEALLRKGPGQARASIIDTFGPTVEPTVIAIAKREAVFGPDDFSRIAAARILQRDYAALALKAFLTDWRRICKWHDTGGPFEDDPLLSDRVDALARGLFEIGSPVALRGLFENLSNKPVEYRNLVIGRLLVGHRPSGNKRRDALIEDFLASELDDHDPSEVPDEQEIGISNVELGDSAASILSKMYPTKYRFKPSAFRYSLFRQRAVFRNVWRVSRGRPSLALPALEKRLRNTAPSDLVTVVKVRRMSPATSGVARIARKMNYKLLTWPALCNLLRCAERVKVPQASCLRINVSRDAPGRGIVLSLDLGIRKHTPATSGINYEVSITMNGSSFDNSTGEFPADGSTFGYYGVALEKCLKSKPTSALDARFLVMHS